ncbi:MAG: hypothetical protein ABW101_12850 [Candidatus Thiodiazotropha sp.]
MRSSLSHESRSQKFFKSLARFLEKWWARYILGPLIVSAPPSLLLAFYKFESIHAKLPEAIVKFFIENQFSSLVFAALYIYILTVIYGVIQGFSQGNDEIDTKGLLSLFDTLEKVVGSKAKRFDNVLWGLENGVSDSDPSAIFLEITQPSQQIALLAEGLHGFFDSIDTSGVSFKVTIALIEGGLPVEWYYYAPASEPPRTQMEVLQQPHSSICKAIKSRRMVVIEDFKAEAEKGGEGAYAVGDSAEIDNGSLICYPLLDPRRGVVPYVLTVVADKKKYFQKKKRPIYQWVVERFVVRMKLEHHLEALKNKASEYTK